VFLVVFNFIFTLAWPDAVTVGVVLVAHLTEGFFAAVARYAV